VNVVNPSLVSFGFFSVVTAQYAHRRLCSEGSLNAACVFHIISPSLNLHRNVATSTSFRSIRGNCSENKSVLFSYCGNCVVFHRMDAYGY